MRISYTCENLSFAITVEQWSNLVRRSREAIDWIEKHEEVIESWIMGFYAFFICSLIQVRPVQFLQALVHFTRPFNSLSLPLAAPSVPHLHPQTRGRAAEHTPTGSRHLETDRAQRLLSSPHQDIGDARPAIHHRHISPEMGTLDPVAGRCDISWTEPHSRGQATDSQLL